MTAPDRSAPSDLPERPDLFSDPANARGGAVIVRPAPDPAAAPEDLRAVEIALAVMGAGLIDAARLAPDAAWERTAAPTAMGRAAIVAAISEAPPLQKIYIEQVVSQGKAATVSGRCVMGDGTARLFCHVIRYTSASAQVIAQIVSFDHRVKGS